MENQAKLIHDWNVAEFDTLAWGQSVDLNDETLRDGLQSPSAIDPPVEDKIRLVHIMDELGIASADIGLPGAGPRAYSDVLAIARAIQEDKVGVRPNCAARTVMEDIAPIVEISQRVGAPIEVCAFIGSSPIRRFTEGWTLRKMLRTAEKSISFAVAEGLPVTFVTEDTTRADPDAIKTLYGNAIRWGASRICVSDTVGHATPSGVRALLRFVHRSVIGPAERKVRVDWHGHRDRGLGLANALVAIEAGADRIHATALGIGERVGNVEMDLLLVNLVLAGAHKADLRRLPEYCSVAARACGLPIPPNYPVLGEDAFRTATGVHAAAVVKARAKGAEWLADRVYSSVPASLVGRSQEIEVGPMSGLSNVRYWLDSRGLDGDNAELCRYIFDAAKAGDHTLTEAEVLSAIRRFDSKPGAPQGR